MNDAISQPYFSQLIQRTYDADVGSAVQPVVSSLFTWTQARIDERPMDSSFNGTDDVFRSDAFRSDAFRSVERTSRLPFLSHPKRELEIFAADDYSASGDYLALRNPSRPSDFAASSEASLSTNPSLHDASTTSEASDADISVFNFNTSEFFESFVSAEPSVPKQPTLSADALGLFPSAESSESAVLAKSEILAESADLLSPLSVSPQVKPLTPADLIQSEAIQSEAIQSGAIQPIREPGISEQSALEQVIPNQPRLEQLISDQTTSKQIIFGQTPTDQLIVDQITGDQVGSGQLTPEPVIHQQTTHNQTGPDQTMSEPVVPNQATSEQLTVNQITPNQSTFEQPITQAGPTQTASNKIPGEEMTPNQVFSAQPSTQQPIDIPPNVAITSEEPLLHSKLSENYTTPSIEPSSPSAFSEDMRRLKFPAPPQERTQVRMEMKQDSPNRSGEQQSFLGKSDVVPLKSNREKITTPAIVRSQTTAQPSLTVTSLVQRSRPISLRALSNPSCDKTLETAAINTITHNIEPTIQPLTLAANPTAAAPESSPEKTTLSSDPTPTVTVTIGRIEIRASQPPSSKTRQPKQRQPKLSLAQYLKQRDQNL